MARFVHVVVPGENYYPMYSVEWFNEKHQMWGQHALTHRKWEARFLAFENMMHHRGAKRRIRVL